MVKTGYARVIEKRIQYVKLAVYTQLSVMVLITLLSSVLYNKKVAYSVFIGSLCSVIPGVYFAYRSLLYKFRIEADPKKFLANLVVAEAVKFILVVCMLVSSYKLIGGFAWGSSSAILTGFIITYLIGQIAPLIAETRKK